MRSSGATRRSILVGCGFSTSGVVEKLKTMTESWIMSPIQARSWSSAVIDIRDLIDALIS
jgi:hypothetical protein